MGMGGCEQQRDGFPAVLILLWTGLCGAGICISKEQGSELRGGKEPGKKSPGVAKGFDESQEN